MTTLPSSQADAINPTTSISDTRRNPILTPQRTGETNRKDAVSNVVVEGQPKLTVANGRMPKTDETIGFANAGVFKLNEQWATAIRYNATITEGTFKTGELNFTNGRKQIAAIKIANRNEAVALLGARNIANIEAGKGREKNIGPGTVKGKLHSGNLAYEESYHPARRTENSIEIGVDRTVEERDADVLAWVTKRRESMNRLRQQRGQNERLIEADGVPTSPSQKVARLDDLTGRERDERQKVDRTGVVPASIRARFIQAGNKYYFPDQTHAFDDRNTKLATRSENHVVLRSLVAIALARGWDRMTVRGTEEFRRAAWLEASLAGIDVHGYKPSKVEKAHLALLLERTQPENVAENGTREQYSAGKEGTTLDATKQVIAAAKTQSDNRQREMASPAQHGAPDIPPFQAATDAPQIASVIIGTLTDHGEANYLHDAKKDKSYFVKLGTARGEQIFWGVDLKRAVIEAGVVIGEKIAIEKQGRIPVTARERLFDEEGEAVGKRPIDTHRNKWFVGSIDKAEAFAHGDRTEVVKQHPDLAPAFGTVSAAQKFSEKQFPKNKENQARFVAVAKQVVTEKIVRGEPIPAPKIREPQRQEISKQQWMDQERDYTSPPVKSDQRKER